MWRFLSGGVDVVNHPGCECGQSLGIWIRLIIRGCGCKQSSGDVNAVNHPGMWMWGFSSRDTDVFVLKLKSLLYIDLTAISLDVCSRTKAFAFVQLVEN